MTNKRTAWLTAPIMERRVKATISDSDGGRQAEKRMTERRDSVGAFSVLVGWVLEKGRFTGPVSTAGDDPERRIAEWDCSLWGI